MRQKILCICLLVSIASMTSGQSWELYTTENSDLPEGNVNVVFVDAYGAKWFGTNQGLVHFSGAVWTTYTVEDGLASNIINDLIGEKTKDSALLYVSTPMGVSELNYDDNIVTGINSYDSATSGLQSDSIITILLDTGLVYYGSPVGLDIRSEESWTFLDHISTIDGDVSLQQISAMASTPHGWNYVGTREHGVARLHYEVDGISGASSYSTEWSGLLSDQINDIYINSEGDQWYATAKGVAFHKGYETKENWETYTELSSELINNMVHAVAVDGNGITWAGTEGGISRFDGVNWISYPYINEISDYAVFDLDFDLDGSIWFACDVGVIHQDEMGFPEGIAEHKTSDLKFQLYPSITSDVVNLKVENTGNTQLSVFVMSLEGRIVKHLMDRVKVFGTHTFLWNVNDPDSQGLEGPYLVVIKTDTNYLSRKIIILR